MSRLKMTDLSIIIPAYNEECGLPLVLERIKDLKLKDSEVIVVDDGSTDSTKDKTQGYDVKLLVHEKNRGKAEAFRTGFAASSGNYIVMVDADNTYPIESIPEIVGLLKGGYDSVVGSRFKGHIKGMTTLNKIGNFSIMVLLRSLFGSKTSDPLSGLRGFRRSVFETINLQSEGFELETEMSIKVASIGLSEIDIPIEYRERQGETKLKPLNDGVMIGRHMLTLLRYYNPLFLFLNTCILLSGSGLLLALFLLYTYVVNNFYFVHPHSAVLSSFLIIAGINLAFFGIVLEVHLFLEGVRKSKSWFKIIINNTFLRSIFLVGMLTFFIGVIFGWVLLSDWYQGNLTTQYPRVGLSVLSMLLGILGLQLIFFSIVLDVISQPVKKRLNQ
ncbi:MAG: glycosyltransferase family 2 protein [Candidatus Altiarchaeota archaeon]